MIEFIGHLHPLLVHLPIGILLLAFLFYLLSQKDRYASLQTALVFTLFMGTVSAFLSCITGYVLSLNGEEDEVLVARHQNLALITTGMSIAWFYVVATDKVKWLQHLLAGISFIGLLITGHWGGALTHGEGYLFGRSEETVGIATTRKPVKDIQEALVYADLVQPLLEEKCVSCHGEKKQKGRLRLDAPDFILKGGEDGIVVKTGNPEGSEIIRRIRLPLTAKAHMPPRDKSQLTPEEIGLLHFWVQSGLAFDKRIRELSPGSDMASMLAHFSDSGAKPATDKPSIELPVSDVPPADPSAVDSLHRKGVVVLPVDRSSHYLQVSFVSADSLTDEDMQLLLTIKDQVLWLDLGGRPFGDASLRSIGQCKNLRRLNLRDTRITDKGMRSLAGLQELTYLNLSGTKVTASGLRSLARLSQLRTIYLFRSGIAAGDWKKVAALFPKAIVDTGTYQVPTLEGDTTYLK